MKIYTKTGDDGTTSLAGGQRVPKTDVRVEAVGTVDELNSMLGWLATQVADAHDRSVVEQAQGALFGMGATLCNDRKAGGVAPAPYGVASLETEIDAVSQTLPPLRSFVLPGGCPAAAICHVCRTVCRRAERRVAALPAGGQGVGEALRYLNRLSDYLFVLARKLNIVSQTEEKSWRFSCK